MRCFFFFVFISIGIWISSGNLAVGQTLTFDHLTLEHGLSESTVLAIAQDDVGFMWFGTREGLNRYDARTIRVFQHQPDNPASLSDNFIYSLLTDRSGRLWVGTRNGLNIFDQKTETFKRYFSLPNNSHSLSDNTATCLLQDRDGRIWIGTRAGLNLLVEGDSISFLHFRRKSGEKNTLVNDDIHSIFQDREGIIWIGTSGGFSRIDFTDPENYSFTSFQLSRVNGRYEKNNSVNAFAEDAYGRLLIGTERSGLLFMNKRTFEFVEPLLESGPGSMATRSILADPSGNFWIGTIGGLFIANHDFTVIKRYRNVDDNPASITDNSIRSIFYDRHGSYWIGTFYGGVNIHSPLSKQFRHLTPRLAGRKVNIKVAGAITTDPHGNFWVGTDGNGLFFMDSQSNVKAHFRHQANSNSLSHDNVKCLLLEGDSGLWIGTIKGLDYYDFHTRRFVHFRNDSANRKGLPDDVIYDILKDKSGKMWVATYFGGLARIDGGRRVVENVYSHDPNNPRTLSSQTVTCLLSDSENNLWVGTASGLNKLQPDGSFLRIPTGDHLNDNAAGLYITTIFEDSHRQVWIGTRGAGLHLLGKNGELVRGFSADDGLSGNSVYGVLEDSRGFLWISTESGLSRFTPADSSFKNYNRSDGLLCQEFNFNSCHRDAVGNFYFGGYNGVARFHPDSIYQNTIVPTVTFTRVRLFNRGVKFGDGTDVMQNDGKDITLQFRHNQNIFSVDFAVLNFINSSKNQFAYKLAGFEDEWNYVREPVATYMNLAPGNYVLMIKGANNDSFWNETPQKLSIVVFPPPWKTWWAYTGYCVVFLFLLFGWARLNNKQITLRHELQLEHLEMQKQEELHSAKLNFFTNIAHEIRTPVTLIASPIEHLLETQQPAGNLKKELTLIKNNSDRLMRLLNQLLDFQKQETGNVILKIGKRNIVPFLKEIVESFREYAHARRVSLSLSHSSDQVDLWFDREELSKVIFNLVANALKFTPGGGEVTVSVAAVSAGHIPASSMDGDRVQIVVQDNGLGIAPGQLEKIFHRFHQAENTGIQDAGFGIGLALSKGL
jgi:ligand-binding sensor domain-containing protein/signal transduction histidine kinase